jgi:hypothetical protein
MDRHSRIAETLLVALALACGGGGGGSNDPRAARLAGGRGLAGDGGRGGPIVVMTASGGDIAFTADASPPEMSTPDIPAPALGTNPLTVAADRTLDVTQPWFGDDGSTPATGLWVKSGTHLVVDAGGAPTAALYCGPGGIRIDGAVTFHPLAGAGVGESSLSLDADGDIAVSGTIETSAAEGGNAAVLTVATRGNIRSSGKWLARGGAGAAGGAGGHILARWKGALVNTGTLDSSGAEGTAGAGGTGGGLELIGDAAGSSLWNRGKLLSLGGSGTAGGGNSGLVAVMAYGDLLSTAPIDVSAGNATTQGDGGMALPVILQTIGGRLVVTGSLSGRGGNGAGTGAGGAGAMVIVVDVDDPARPDAAVGSFLSGAVDGSGGDGAKGGDAGGLNVMMTLGAATARITGPAITFAGISALDATGGPGTATGGDGVPIVLMNSPLVIGSDSYVGNVGGQVDLLATGGAGGAGDGGQGGTLHIGGTDLVCRDADASGGASAEAAGGAGGTITAVAAGKVDYRSLTAAGGTGKTANGAPGNVIVQGSEL